jgi:hypothetical protein
MAKRMTPLRLIKGTPLKRLNYKTGSTRALEAEFDVLKADFASNQFENLYANLMNPYAGMENVFEEGQIAMKGYELQQRNLQEGLATTLDTMRQSGTGSGYMNVQSLANALTKQSEQMSANIEQQETQNLKLAQQESARLEGLERQGEYQVELAKIKGQEDVRNLELQKQQALLTLVSGQISAAKAEDYKTKGWLSKLLNL